MKTTRLVDALATVAAMLFVPDGRAAQPSAMTLTGDTPWVVAADEPEAVQRALRDVQADWKWAES